MKVSLPRTGTQLPEKKAVSLSKAAARRAHLGDPEADAEGIVVATFERRLQGEPGIDAEVDQVAIARATHHPDEHVERTRTVIGRTPDHLVRHGVDAEVVPPQQRDTGAGGVGERRPALSNRWSGNGPLSYQKPSL